MFYRLANLIASFLSRLFARLEITGRENVPKDGALMVVMNHINFLDAPVVGIAVDRRIRWMAKVELWDNPAAGIVMDQYGAFPIHRGEVDRRALGRAVAIMRGGGVLGISPEGHRSSTASLGRAKPGAARLALQTDTPILPVAVAGTEKAVRTWLKLQRPLIHVRIGEPFKLPAERPVSKERQQELVDEVMLHLAALLPESYRGVYANGMPGPEVEAYTPPLPD